VCFRALPLPIDAVLSSRFTMRVLCLYSSLSVAAARSHVELPVEIPKFSFVGDAYKPSLTAVQQRHTLLKQHTCARGQALWVAEAVNRNIQHLARRCSCVRRGTLQLRGGGSSTSASPGTARIARSAAWIVGLGSVLAIIARPHNGVRSLDTVKLALLLVTTLAAALQFAAGSAEQANSTSSSSSSTDVVKSEPLPAGFMQFRAAYMVVHVLCLFAEFLPTAYLYKVSCLLSACAGAPVHIAILLDWQFYTCLGLWNAIFMHTYTLGNNNNNRHLRHAALAWQLYHSCILLDISLH
jgi:hypothetical protein